jgi:hypothetical protein
MNKETNFKQKKSQQILDKQTVVLSILDDIRYNITKLQKGQSIIMEHIRILEDRTKNIDYKITLSEEIVSDNDDDEKDDDEKDDDEKDDDEKDDDEKDDDEKDDDEKDDDEKDDDEKDDDELNNHKKIHNHKKIQNHKKIHNNKKIYKHTKSNIEKNNIIANIPGVIEIPMNYLSKNQECNPEMFLHQLCNMLQKKKETNVNTELIDQEYDPKSSIYNENEIIKSDDDIESEFVYEKILNIYDIIKIGLEYTEYKKNNVHINKSSKKNNKDTTEKKITECYEINNKKYSINLILLEKLVKPLQKLGNMIGLKKVKNDIFNTIIYYLQKFENNNNNMMHTTIEGPPGTGKTQLGKILAQIYCALGIIPSASFKYIKATDLIGECVGSSRQKTQKVIDEANGGVLFIDEAYSLSSMGKDPYGKECIDTLNYNLDEKKHELIIIIAGYPKQLDKYFFSVNDGLQRRFTIRYLIDEYSPLELKDIFLDKLRRDKWFLSKKVDMQKFTELFTQNKEFFTNFGGDIENYFKKCKFAHSNRVISLQQNVKKILTNNDLKKGLEIFKQNKPKTEDIWKNMFI